MPTFVLIQCLICLGGQIIKATAVKCCDAGIHLHIINFVIFKSKRMLLFCCLHRFWFRVPTFPGRSWIFILKILGPGKSWKSRGFFIGKRVWTLSVFSFLTEIDGCLQVFVWLYCDGVLRRQMWTWDRRMWFVAMST